MSAADPEPIPQAPGTEPDSSSRTRFASPAAAAADHKQQSPSLSSYAEDGESLEVRAINAAPQRRQQLEHHLRSSPTDRDAYLELAKIYRDEQRPMDAQRVLKSACNVFPDDEQLLWEFEEATLARSLQKLREVSQLARRLETAEADHELERSRGDWARRRIEVCRARLARDPSLKHLRLKLSEGLYDEGRYRDAIAEVGSILDDNALSCPAYLLIGRCHLALGEDEQALPKLRAASLRRAVAATPNVRLAALRLLCDTAERLGLSLTLTRYRHQLAQAERVAATIK